MNTKCNPSDPSPATFFGSHSCRACKDFFSRSNNNPKDKKQLKIFTQECTIKCIMLD